MKQGTKVLTKDGPGVVFKSKNGQYVTWVWVKFTDGKKAGTTSPYIRETLKEIQ